MTENTNDIERQAEKKLHREMTEDTPLNGLLGSLARDLNLIQNGTSFYDNPPCPICGGPSSYGCVSRTDSDGDPIVICVNEPNAPDPFVTTLDNLFSYTDADSVSVLYVDRGITENCVVVTCEATDGDVVSVELPPAEIDRLIAVLRGWREGWQPRTNDVCLRSGCDNHRDDVEFDVYGYCPRHFAP